MNRKTIDKAAWDYAEGIQQDEYRKKYSWEDFKAGAEWRVNSVWHDVTEKPNGMFVILIDFGTRLGAEEYSFGMTSEHLEGAIRWAYVADLMPNRKEGRS